MKRLSFAVWVVLGLAAAMAAAWWLQNRPTGADGATLSTSAKPAAGASGPAAPGGGKPGAGPAAAGPATVEVGRVMRVRLEDDATAVGNLRSNQGVMLRPEVSGRIVKLGFTDGQRVQRGQLLVQLDNTLQQAQLRQAEAQAGIARTNLQRSRDLQAQSFVSQSAVDQNQAALEVTLAQVALAQAQLQRLAVLAPFDGVAGIRLVNVGDYVKDGADLVNLEDNSSMWVDFRLPERYLSRIRPGQAISLDIDALPGQRLSAKVVALDSQIDANGRSVLVRARTAAGDKMLRPGMFARVRLVFDVQDNALMVPEEALVPQGGKQFVLLLDDGVDANGQPTKLSRRVEASIGQRSNGQVQLLAGVKEGDTVVLAGQARLMRADGLPVRVVDLARAGRAAGGPGGAAARSGAASGAKTGTPGGAAASGPAGQAPARAASAAA